MRVVASIRSLEQPLDPRSRETRTLTHTMRRSVRRRVLTALAVGCALAGGATASVTGFSNCGPRRATKGLPPRSPDPTLCAKAATVSSGEREWLMGYTMGLGMACDVRSRASGGAHG